jgi:hypothetical protein
MEYLLWIALMLLKDIACRFKYDFRFVNYFVLLLHVLSFSRQCNHYRTWQRPVNLFLNLKLLEGSIYNPF